MKLKYKIYLLSITAISLIHSTSIFATGMGGQGGKPCGGPFGDPCPVPIDSGVGLLLATGLLYGGKRIYDSFKK